jgi:hypothetical protein
MNNNTVQRDAKPCTAFELSIMSQGQEKLEPKYIENNEQFLMSNTATGIDKFA